jgi:hypothetical protein
MEVVTMPENEIVVSSQLVARPGYRRTGKRFKPDGRPPFAQRRSSGDGSVRYIDHRGFEHVWRDQRGPWYESTSCSVLPAEGRIRKPFILDGKSYVSMGHGPGRDRCEAWRVVPLSQWNTAKWGRPTTHAAKTGGDQGAFARRDPRGFYHRMTAKCGQETWVFLGPPVTLVADDNPRLRQLGLFEFLDQ